MARAKKILAPTYTELIVPTYKALLALGGSGTNNEICDQVIEAMKLPDEIVDEMHSENGNQTELEYQLAWARTNLKNYGVIVNSERGVWSITGDYNSEKELDPKKIVGFTVERNQKRREATDNVSDKQSSEMEAELTQDDSGYPEEIKPWRQRLMSVLLQMDPFAFERLIQRLLRECGFDSVEVTQPTRDGGIDGRGILKINGTISFNVVFQCKRYKGAVGAHEIRGFRGSLTEGERGILITTGAFTKEAKKEASSPGKNQIDLIDGEELVNMIAQNEVGVRRVTTYEIDEDFFESV